MTHTRARLHVLVALLLVTLAVAVAAPARAGRAPAGAATSDHEVLATSAAETRGEWRRGIARGTNDVRDARSIQRVRWNRCLDNHAQRFSQHLVASNHFHHQDMRRVLERCNMRGVGENLAVGYPTSGATVRAWMNSSGHRANLLEPSYDSIGVGMTRGPRGMVVVQLFGNAP